MLSFLAMLGSNYYDKFMAETLYSSNTLIVERASVTFDNLRDWQGEPPLYDLNAGNHPVQELAVATNTPVHVRLNGAIPALYERSPGHIRLKHIEHRICHSDNLQMRNLCASETPISNARLNRLFSIEPDMRRFVSTGRRTLAGLHINALTLLDSIHNVSTVSRHLANTPRLASLMSKLALYGLCDQYIADGLRITEAKLDTFYEDVGTYGVKDATPPDRGLLLTRPGLAALDILRARLAQEKDEVTVVDDGRLLPRIRQKGTLEAVDASVNYAVHKEYEATGQMEHQPRNVLLRIIDASRARQLVPDPENRAISSQYDLLMRGQEDAARQRVHIPEALWGNLLA